MESFDVLEISAMVPRISEETQNEIVQFLDSQEHQDTALPEDQPKLTTAHSKISRVTVDDLTFEQMQIFVVGKSYLEG